MNPFEKHGIVHLSASSLNAARSSQAYWLISYLAKVKDSGSIAMLAGQAAEEAVSRKLFNPDIPTDECVEFAAKIFKQKTALGGHDPEDRESKLEEIVGRVADGRKKAFDGMVRNAIVALSPYGIPTSPENSERQHRIEIRLEGIPVPIIGYMRLPDVESCIDHINRHGITTFIVDPFIETHECEENSNQQIKRVGQMFRDIARRANCAVMLVHHTAKPQQGSSEGHAGNMNTARGASALIGVSRVIETLFGMSKKDAERHNIRENLRHLYVRLDDAKANLSLASPEAKWFKRVGVVIANTDEVGILEPVTLDDRLLHSISDQDDTNHTVIASLAAQIKEDVLTLNAAAIRLAWGGSARFVEYRQQDDKGHQRASKTLRNMIENACRANKVIVTGTEACGFVIDNTVRPVVIKRFSRPAEASDLAAQPPDFPDIDDMEDDHDF